MLAFPRGLWVPLPPPPLLEYLVKLYSSSRLTSRNYNLPRAAALRTQYLGTSMLMSMSYFPPSTCARGSNSVNVSGES